MVLKTIDYDKVADSYLSLLQKMVDRKDYFKFGGTINFVICLNRLQFQKIYGFYPKAAYFTFKLMILESKEENSTGIFCDNEITIKIYRNYNNIDIMQDNALKSVIAHELYHQFIYENDIKQSQRYITDNKDFDYILDIIFYIFSDEEIQARYISCKIRMMDCIENRLSNLKEREEYSGLNRNYEIKFHNISYEEFKAKLLPLKRVLKLHKTEKQFVDYWNKNIESKRKKAIRQLLKLSI